MGMPKTFDSCKGKKKNKKKKKKFLTASFLIIKILEAFAGFFFGNKSSYFVFSLNQES